MGGRLEQHWNAALVTEEATVSCEHHPFSFALWAGLGVGEPNQEKGQENQSGWAETLSDQLEIPFA